MLWDNLQKCCNSDISNYWYLFLSVIIGGQIGNFLNLKVFPTKVLALITSLLFYLLLQEWELKYLFNMVAIILKKYEF